MASADSLRALLQPKSIAVVGASAKGGRGYDLLTNAVNLTFPGPIWPVNPNYEEILSLKCYANLASLPGRPDCVIVMVPARAALKVLAEAGELGIRSAIVVANNFGESGAPDGDTNRVELQELARRYDMAVAGPNCLGIASLVYEVYNYYSFVPRMRSGGISLISQSGGLLNAAAGYLKDREAGMNYMISFGNQCVVEVADYIDFLAADPATSVIACIMEGAVNGRRFREAVERASRIKPIVVQKLGRSEPAQAIALAHTGTLAGDNSAFEALFRQNGVAVSESLDTLLETAILFDKTHVLPRGKRAMMMTISGGTTGLIADVGEAAGLSFPPFSNETRARIDGALGMGRPIHNPIDTISWPALSDPGRLDSYIDIALDDPDIDVFALGYRVMSSPVQHRMLKNLAERARTASKALLCISTVSYTAGPLLRDNPDLLDLPLVEDMERGQRALSRVCDYGLFRASLSDEASSRPFDQAAVVISSSRETLTEYESKRLLRDLAFPITREALATSADDAARMAEEIGFPVAMKIQSPDIPHKSDIGGVVLRIGSAEEARRTFTEMSERIRGARPDADIDGILVQEMVSGGVEMILGMAQSELGPLVMLGMGGVFVELLKDVAVRIAPLSRAEVLSMLSQIRSAKLLNGYRGAPPSDVDALVEMVVKFSQFVATHEQALEAIDINPLIVRPRGSGLRIADALIVPRRSDGRTS